jgi:hypothetical protein
MRSPATPSTEIRAVRSLALAASTTATVLPTISLTRLGFTCSVTSVANLTTR